MSDEPLAKKAFMRVFGGKPREKKVENEALQLNSKMPTELARILNDDRHEAPIVLRMIEGVIKREHLKVDTAELEAYAAKIKAGQNVVDAITALKVSMHQASQLDARLEREKQLAETQHETKIMEEAARQQAIAPSPIRQQIEEERAQLELDRIKAERDAPLRKQIEEERAQLELDKIRAERAALQQPKTPDHQPDRIERFKRKVEGRMAEVRREHGERTVVAEWLTATYRAEIEFLRKTGKEVEAEALEMELADRLDTLDTDGL